MDHLEDVVGALDKRTHHGPLGGRRVRADPTGPRGHGAVGVAMNSAPTRGSSECHCRRSGPPFRYSSPANRHRAVGLSFERWEYAFANTFSEDGARRLYGACTRVPASARSRGAALANIPPGQGRRVGRLPATPRGSPCCSSTEALGPRHPPVSSSSRTPSTTRPRERSRRSSSSRARTC